MQYNNLPINLIITPEKRVFVLGEPVMVKTELKNNSDKEVMIVIPADGSEAKMRYPHFYFEFTGKDAKAVKNKARCGVVDPLVLDSFAVVPSGEGIALSSMWSEGDISKFMDIPTGEYRVHCFYSTDTEDEKSWHGRYSDEEWKKRDKNEFWAKRDEEMRKINQLLKKVPRMNLKSNSVRIKIVDKLESFSDKYYQIKEAMSRVDVGKFLGEPARKKIAVLPRGPFYGPQEGLVKILKPGSEYEEWEYESDNIIYFIWFGSVGDVNSANWKVIDVGEYPKGAVF